MAERYEVWAVQTVSERGEPLVRVVTTEGHLLSWPVFTDMARWTGECGYWDSAKGRTVWLMQPRAWVNEATGAVVKKPKLDSDGQPLEGYRPVAMRKVRLWR